MKKEYMKPEAMLVVIEDQLMLSTSGTSARKDGEVLGRRGRNYDDWGDEEEDF